MLTIEMLQQNTQLSGLTAEQFQSIAEMSRNDENTVIGTKIGALHGQYDTDILNIIGIAKNSGEKSYDYLNRVLKSNKTELDAFATTKQELATAKANITRLEKKIAEGAQDETLKQQLKDAKQQVTQLQSQLSTKQQEFDTEKQRLEKELQSTHVDYAFAAATSGIKFKSDLPVAIQKTLLNAAKAEVLAKGTPEFQQNADGTQKLVFRDTAGNVLNNPKNNLNSYTFEELIMETSLKDVVDTGRQQQGGGTGPLHTGGNGGGSLLDLSGARTQIEADRAIENYLLSNSITRDSEELASQSM